MKLVVGLGNPGKKYANNRHNVGWLALDHIVKLNKWPKPKLNKRYKAELSEIGEGRALLVKPLTFMNDSGAAVAKLAKFYKLDAADVAVIYDDIDLAFGTLRLRSGGSSAGHQGIGSLIKALGMGFYRIRIGVDNNQRYKIGATSFVLSNLETAELKQLPAVFESVNKTVSDFLTYGSLEPTTETLA